jgi:hypothetical protein
MTDGQSAPIWGLRPEFYYCQTIAGLLMWGALFDERTDLSFTIVLVLDSVVILGAEYHGTRDHILLSQIRDFPFRRLLRLAGLRRRYSNPPPRGCVCKLSQPSFVDWRENIFFRVEFIRSRKHLRWLATSYNWLPRNWLAVVMQPPQ